jgi:uncharacterized protein
MMKEVNPFNLGSILSDNRFCNRTKELSDLVTHAKNGANVILFSSRRRGKTSLVRRVLDEMSGQGYLAIYVDFLSVISEKDISEKLFNAIARGVGQDITDKTFIDKTKRLFRRISPSIDIGPDGGISISAKYDRSETFDHLIDDIFLGLNRYLQNNKLRGLVVLDEFQEITSLPENKRIEGSLREHIQNQSNTAFFFVGSRRHVLRSMFTDSKRAFYRLGFIYEMGNISKAEFVPYIVSCFRETGKECPEVFAGEIYDYAEGNTYYVQKLSHLLWNLTLSKKKATQEILTEAKTELLKSEAAIFQAFFVEINLGEKKLIRALGKEPTRKPYSMDYLTRHGLSAGGLQKSLRSLIDKDIIEAVDGTYCLVDSVFGKWIMLNE